VGELSACALKMPIWKKAGLPGNITRAVQRGNLTIIEIKTINEEEENQ